MHGLNRRLEVFTIVEQNAPWANAPRMGSVSKGYGTAFRPSTDRVQSIAVARRSRRWLSSLAGIPRVGLVSRLAVSQASVLCCWHRIAADANVLPVIERQGFLDGALTDRRAKSPAPRPKETGPVQIVQLDCRTVPWAAPGSVNSFYKFYISTLGWHSKIRQSAPVSVRSH